MKLILLVIPYLIGITISYGCSCKEISVEEKLEYSDSVILARIVDVKKVEEDRSTPLLAEKVISKIQVLQSFDGKFKEGDIISVSTGAPCPYPFHKGYDHLIYLKNSEEGLSTAMCAGNITSTKGKRTKILEEEILLIGFFLSKEKDLNQAAHTTAVSAPR
ncbi:hypothetical protein [Pelagicoccus albus]|uniref:Tissue inhibitor of metalloproteinase n=1 Tax=Pelagicoccus albus TaxID=415222 RepID=A0A7X1B631_9BACT|nr:hypothetical protein [Pelagicoccus albus]MBC2606295.1 hypothetical protein [Pelagicoccus albus]